MLNLAGIISDSIVDGPGIRTAFFCQGCPHHCPGCHNPETWEFGVGQDMDTETLVAIVRSNPLCRGVTFSGGEPFAQAGDFARLAIALKRLGYEIASYSGFTFEELLSGTPDQRQLLRNIDVLIDGRFRQEEKSLELAFRGSRNQRILDVPKSLAHGSPVWMPPAAGWENTEKTASAQCKQKAVKEGENGVIPGMGLHHFLLFDLKNQTAFLCRESLILSEFFKIGKPLIAGAFIVFPTIM